MTMAGEDVSVEPLMTAFAVSMEADDMVAFTWPKVTVALLYLYLSIYPPISIPVSISISI